MLTDPWLYAAAVPAVLIAGVSKGGFGGGLGVVGVPLIALVVGPKQAAALMLPILCLMDLVALRAYGRRWDWANLKVMLCGAPLGIGLGALTFGYLPDDAIRLLIGLIAVGFTLDRWRKRRRVVRASRPSAWRGGVWSAAAGFTSFVAHAGGPPVNVYLLPQRLDRTVYQATTVGFFAAINYVKLAPYALLGQFPAEVLLTAAALAPVAVAGILLGVWLHDRVNQELFYRLCYLFLFVTGLKLTYDGLAPLVGGAV